MNLLAGTPRRQYYVRALRPSHFVNLNKRDDDVNGIETDEKVMIAISEASRKELYGIGLLTLIENSAGLVTFSIYFVMS